MTGVARLAVPAALLLPAVALALAAARVLGGSATTRPSDSASLAAATATAALSVGMAALVLGRSASPAARPLLLILCCTAVWAIEVLCGVPDALSRGVATLARGLLPAALVHLVLTFPREREILREAPGLLTALYGMAAGITALAEANVVRATVVTDMTARLSEWLCVASWIALLVACFLARRESSSALERARADVVLRGALAIPVLSLTAGWLLDGAAPGETRVAAVLGAVLLPMPVGYAIVRYQLFDANRDVRRAASALSELSVAFAVLYLLAVAQAALPDTWMVSGSPEAFFATGLAGYVLATAARTGVRRAGRGWTTPDSARLRDLAGAHARGLAQTRPDELAADRLCEALEAGLSSQGVSVFECAEGRWQVVAARGRRAVLDEASAARAGQLIGERDLAHLVREEQHPCERGDRLRALGVELVSALRSGGQLLGLTIVCVARDRRPASTVQLGFARAVCAQAAMALHRARLTRELVNAERFAAVGRMGVHLAHDLGKPLGLLDHIARSIVSRAPESAAPTSELESIARLSGELRRTLRGVVEAAARSENRWESSSAVDRAVDLARVIDRAARTASSLHGADRIAIRLPPGLPAPRGNDDCLVRALTNVLDNALLASPEGELVELVVTAGPEVWIDVIDRGCGVSADRADRVFEPFFREREHSPGSGLGLAIARELVESMGGTIALESIPGLGTRVRMALPSHSPGEGIGRAA